MLKKQDVNKRQTQQSDYLFAQFYRINGYWQRSLKFVAALELTYGITSATQFKEPQNYIQTLKYD